MSVYIKITKCLPPLIIIYTVPTDCYIRLTTSHTYGRSPVWVRMCLVKSPLEVNPLPHPATSHTYGRSPVWVRLCFVKCPLSVNALPQTTASHTYGRSPVWVRMCLTKFPLEANPLPHPTTSQTYGRSPVLVRLRLRFVDDALSLVVLLPLLDFADRAVCPTPAPTAGAGVSPAFISSVPGPLARACLPPITAASPLWVLMWCDSSAARRRNDAPHPFTPHLLRSC